MFRGKEYEKVHGFGRYEQGKLLKRIKCNS